MYGNITSIFALYLVAFFYLGKRKAFLPGLKNPQKNAKGHKANVPVILPCKTKNLKLLFQANTVYIPLFSGGVQADKFYYSCGRRAWIRSSL